MCFALVQGHAAAQCWWDLFSPAHNHHVQFLRTTHILYQSLLIYKETEKNVHCESDDCIELVAKQLVKSLPWEISIIMVWHNVQSLWSDIYTSGYRKPPGVRVDNGQQCYASWSKILLYIRGWGYLRTIDVVYMYRLLPNPVVLLYSKMEWPGCMHIWCR